MNTVETDRRIIELEQKVEHIKSYVEQSRALTQNINELTTAIQLLKLEIINLGSKYDDRLHALNNRIDRLEDEIDARFKDHGLRIAKLENKGGQRWETIVQQIIMVAVAGIVSFVMIQLFAATPGM